MGIVHLNGPPDCPSARGWCIICQMRAKQKQWEMSEIARQAAYDSPGDQVKYIAWPAVLTQELQAGDYRGVAGEYPMLGIIDGICWDDMAGVEPTTAPVPTLLQANGPLPPGLKRKGD